MNSVQNKVTTNHKSNWFLPLLHNRGQLSDSLALLAQNILSASCLDDDFSSDRRHSDLQTGIPILSELARKQLNNKKIKILLIIIDH